MPVPRISQLHAGAAVNIVLKADQPSGKVTAGQIADILTKGDHPRGVKVRLANGQIGRVQSLNGSTTSTTSQQSSSQIQPMGSQSVGDNLAGASKGGRYGMAQDIRQDGYDYAEKEESSSLFDYVRPAKQRKGKKSKPNTQPDDAHEKVASSQADLEAEFPNLDTALITAIVADHQSVDEARSVLKGLSCG